MTHTKRLLLLFIAIFLAACSTASDPAVEETIADATSTSPPAATDAPEATDTAVPADTAVPDPTDAPTIAPEPTEEEAMEEPAESAEEIAARYAEYEIVTLLPRDAIPAIDDPKFVSLPEADSQYQPQELVIGVVFNGDARAYSVPTLSSHEIVNDTVGDVKISVTW